MTGAEESPQGQKRLMVQVSESGTFHVSQQVIEISQDS